MLEIGVLVEGLLCSNRAGYALAQGGKMKNHPATKELQSLKRLHRKEVGLLFRKKPLDLNLDGENAGRPTGPFLTKAEEDTEVLGFFDAMNMPESEDEP